MSTPPPPAAGERRKSLGRYVKRMSSVFKREKPGHASASGEPSTASRTEESSKEPPQALSTAVPATSPVEQPPSVAQEQPAETSAATNATASNLTPTASNLTPTTSIQAAPPVLSDPALDRRAMQHERARTLFAKYGLTLESHEWTAAAAPAPLVPRVEKPIRMRVHRSCHQCGNLYGRDKTCAQCNHKRCKQCPRFPKKKSSAADKDKEKAKPHDSSPDQPKKKKLFTVTTRHGTELAYQPATQRIRRSCHKCAALFVPATATICASCSHTRCVKCPREPAKRDKWPSGYPGDVAADSDADEDVGQDADKALDQFRRIWRKPRRIVRWECDECGGLFRQGSPLCPGCGHERCGGCVRSPVKKPRQEEAFDPAVVAAVEAKLRALGVDDDPPTSEPEHA